MRGPGASVVWGRCYYCYLLDLAANGAARCDGVGTADYNRRVEHAERHAEAMYRFNLSRDLGADEEALRLARKELAAAEAVTRELGRTANAKGRAKGYNRIRSPEARPRCIPRRISNGRISNAERRAAEANARRVAAVEATRRQREA